MKAGLKIGQLGYAVGMNTKTIRYYEQIGLVPKAQRNSSGYRVYPEGEVARLKFISRAKLLGLSLREVKEITGYVADGRCVTAQTRVAALVSEKIGEIDANIAELTALRADLCHYKVVIEDRIEVSSEVGEKRKIGDCSCLADAIKVPCQEQQP